MVWTMSAFLRSVAYLCLTKHEATPAFKIWHSRLHKRTPPQAYVPHCPAYAPNCLFAGHLPVSLTALLWASRNISQMPNWLSSETLTWEEDRRREEGVSFPLWLGLGCSSAISQLVTSDKSLRNLWSLAVPLGKIWYDYIVWILKCCET